MATHSTFLPGEFHGRSSLTGYSPRSHKESDTIEAMQAARIHEVSLGRTSFGMLSFDKYTTYQKHHLTESVVYKSLLILKALRFTPETKALVDHPGRRFRVLGSLP